jgi:hypothetical protein
MGTATLMGVGNWLWLAWSLLAEPSPIHGLNISLNSMNMTNYDMCCVREHLLFFDVRVNTCQARVMFDTPHTEATYGKDLFS